MSNSRLILDPLRTFAEAVTDRMTASTPGEPENQLRAPFEAFMQAVGEARHVPVLCTGEARVRRLGKPDYAVHSAGLLVGFAELKAPGTRANPNKFSAGSHNGQQWRRFQAFPNLLYCDGNEWGLYRSGERERRIVRLTGDVTEDGPDAVAPKDADALWSLLADFLQWRPIIPDRVEDLPKLLAPLCRSLRDDVTEALADPNSPLHDLARDWRQLLFPDASDEQFADAYAQTVTFALLLARSEGADPLTLTEAQNALAVEHSLLSRALQVLTDTTAREEISASLNMLLRLIQEVQPETFTPADGEDPWLFFYEDFLAVYDPQLRKDAGAYYTPVQVVRAQVRLIDDLLTGRLGKPLGFADPDVVTLDPAAGTGTYLLGVIDHALGRVEAEQGAGAVPGKASDLARNIYGFEIMVGPFAVTELRVSQALESRGAELPDDGTHVYLTDTLESPYATPRQLPLYLQPIADQHAKALDVKENVSVIVCLGNPPYDRNPAADPDDPASRARTGHWVRWGDDGDGAVSILRDFTEPTRVAGHAGHLKNLYNLYVYFWRWALWKVFEAETMSGPGIVSFISACSYLDGDAFCGMREHMRRICDEIWVLDLGGEGRGTRQTENVFAIQTPVAITVAFRHGDTDKENPATVRYADLVNGLLSRDDKLLALDTIDGFRSLEWQDCPDEWHAPFRPAGTGTYFRWPQLKDMFPWQHSGAQFKRTWPICPCPDTLQRRWRSLLKAGNRADAFKETRDRKVTRGYSALPDADPGKPIAELDPNAPPPPMERYAYRSFDRQWVFADTRLGDFIRPVFWAAHGDGQLYLASLLTMALGQGAAATVSTYVPDLHCFAGPGKGAKDVMPLYRDAACEEANILPELLNLLAEQYGQDVSPEDFLAYVYGVLAQPAFTERFVKELGTRELRVPLTKDRELFEEVRNVGANLLWLHTYGERYVPGGEHKGRVPRGKAKCMKAVPGDDAGYPEDYEYSETTKTLHVGNGAFAPVEPEVYEFEVSGLKVVQSWLGYRMKKPRGRKSSDLDDINPTRWPSEFTTELLELLWVLEHTLAEYPKQAELLERLVSGECFQADELPEVPEQMRRPPRRRTQQEFFDNNND